MICRQCGTEIADKAIVCYRCGTGTTEPARKPAEIRRRSPVLGVVVGVILLILLIGAALYLVRTYHLVGIQLFLAGAHESAGILIDFSAAKCLTPV